MCVYVSIHKYIYLNITPITLLAFLSLQYRAPGIG